MTAITVAKRLVFHVGGYDPITPHAGAYPRFVRELNRFERTWSVKASTAALDASADEAKWGVITSGPNWRVETEYHFIRWDDVIETLSRQPMWRRVGLGLAAFSDFVGCGALRGYFRTNWHYALFFLYPFFIFGALVAVACFAGAAVLLSSGSNFAGVAAGLVMLAASLLGPWRWLHIAPLFDDWIFSRRYIRRGDSIIERRLDGIAREIVSAARGSDVDEIVVVGHSLGAVIAVDLLDRALRLDPDVGVSAIPVTFLSIGSSILKIGLHRGAKRFRAAIERVARAPGVFWGDYQARIDIMNFYNTHPMAEMSLTTEYGPVVRLVEFSRMLERVVYRRIRLRFFRVHCQFIRGNDRRAAYDYFMLLCGPISAKCQTRAPDGALSMIGEDGMLIDTRACHETFVEAAALAEKP